MNRLYPKNLCLTLCAVSCLMTLLAAPRPVPALDLHKTIAQYTRRTWTSEQGLPQNSVHAIAQTPDGYLWFGTEEGIARFDGVRFTVNNKINADVRRKINVKTLFVDRQGDLWIGTKGEGLLRWHGDGFDVFTKQNNLADNYVNGICEDRDGNLWIATFGGVSRFADNRFTNYTAADGLTVNSAFAVRVDRNDAVWVGTSSGLNRFQDNQWTQFRTAQGLSNDAVLSLEEDREGALWIGTRFGISKFDGDKFTSFASQNKFKKQGANALLEDRNGNLWIASDGAGINRLSGNRLSSFNADDGLTHTTALSLYEDREGNVWFGTIGGGVSVFKTVSLRLTARAKVWQMIMCGRCAAGATAVCRSAQIPAD